MGDETAERDPRTGLILDVGTDRELDALITELPRLIVYFHADWATPCVQVGQLVQTLHQTTSTSTTTTTPPPPHAITLARVDGGKHPGVAKEHDVQRVPTVLFYAVGRCVGKVEGADTRRISQYFRALSNDTDDELLTKACELLVKRSQVVALVKPRCPFCARALRALREHGVDVDVEDVAGDVAVRDRVKEVAGHESFPMVFARGRLVGGVDAVERLGDEKRLLAELAREGDDAAPQVNADVEGEDGGNGTGNKMEDGGEGVKKKDEKIKEVEELQGRLERLVSGREVMLFMKGSPQDPKCGFSRRMVDTLAKVGVRDYGTFDILTDNEVREGLKAFAKWPTYPQLYAGGRFIGGLDVVNELAEVGELHAELSM